MIDVLHYMKFRHGTQTPYSFRKCQIPEGALSIEKQVISENTPSKIGVLSEKTYNFAPSTDKK